MWDIVVMAVIVDVAAVERPQQQLELKGRSMLKDCIFF
jgi:hypothetical protein